MAVIRVFLESGFEHDTVALSSAEASREERDVTTRYQTGLARIVEMAVPGGRSSTVRIAARGLAGEAAVDPGATPYLRVNLADGGLTAQPEPAPPMYA